MKHRKPLATDHRPPGRPVREDAVGPPHWFGYVALVGRTNVGKSTLLNRLIRFPIAIVTPRPQTTRHRIVGILTKRGYQIVFLDTPGLLEPRYALQEAMMRSARRAISNADLLLYLVEASRDPQVSEEVDRELLHRMRKGRRALLAINKIDLIRKDVLLPQLEYYQKLRVFEEMVPISALTGGGVDSLEAALVQHLPEGPALFPEDELTDQPERFVVAEIVRGVIFEQYGEEIPYSTAVEVTEFREGGVGRKDHVVAAVYVERDSQKGIIIGRGASALKRVGITARQRIEAVLGRSVYLELRVRVRSRWRRKPADVAAFGY
jgi:GTP-binding protein Era